MKRQIKQLASTLLIVSIAALGGCSTHQVSDSISDDGVATGLIFPTLDERWASGSIFPSDESLRQVGPGVTKHELYHLFGPPHFEEAHGAREWDYVFHFRDVANGPVRMCQYKVIFDTDMKGQNFHWKPEGCYKSPVPTAPVVPVTKRFSLDADALFAFDRHGLQDMKPEGRIEIDKLADTLKQYQSSGDVQIRVVGHTDRLGDDYYNLNLSQLRANTVKSYLIERGVSRSSVTSEGAGESQPVKQCSANLSRPALISCLQPNRRVEVIVKGLSK